MMVGNFNLIGGGIMKYQFACISNLIGPGNSKQKEKDAFDVLHQNIALLGAHQSDNKMPRWSIRYVALEDFYCLAMFISFL